MVNLLNYFKTAPPFSVWKSHPDQPSQVLITAGIDGDEFAAIDLSVSFIKSYQGDIPVTVIPVVNLAGYQAHTSYNPQDSRYPKHIFPGSRWGSSSSRLMHEVSKYTIGVKLWIDLHCGATGETLIPFAWASHTYPPLTYLDTRVLIESSVDKNLPYVMLEGADISWINKLIKNLDSKAVPNWHPTYTKHD